MQTEIEAKFLNIDHDEMRAKLKKINAKCIRPMQLMRRINYDYPDQEMRLDKINGWVRLRDEGDKITIAYKQLNSRSLHGTKEVEFEVNDYDTADQFLLSIGLVRKSDQETKRESWVYGNTKIELDVWPWINTFLEIEAESENEVWKAASALGLKKENALFGSVEVAYQAEYDVSEEEIDGWETLKFTPVPNWLKIKQKDKS